MSSWHSYPSIYNVGHAALTELFDGPVVVEEKIDGSQFSFGVFDGVPRIRSKGLQMVWEKPEGMFVPAMHSVKDRLHLLRDGWTYRAEYLMKPKHNTLCYARAPKDYLIIFDVNPAEEQYLGPVEKKAEAERIGLECVPELHPKALTVDAFHELLQTLSCLGGQLIEGLVIKNYAKFGPSKKALMGKHVSEAFKEVHKGEWRAANPGQSDIILGLGDKYRTPARWQKAVQHLAEGGRLEGSPRDIGNLMTETVDDVKRECEAEIKEALFAYAWPKIRRSLTRGLPEWYKDQLLKKQFEGTGA